MTTSTEPICIRADFFIKSYEEFGEDFVSISFTGNRQDKQHQVSYYTTVVRTPTCMRDTYPLDTYPPLLKHFKMVIFKCPTPEERLKRKGCAPTFGFDSETKDKNGDEVGRAVRLFEDAWISQVEKYKKSSAGIAYRNYAITELSQKVYGSPLKPLEKPIIRIKYRARSKADTTLRGNIRTLRNGVISSFASNGGPFTEANISDYVVGGSISTGVIDFATTMISQGKFSNSICVATQIIEPPASNVISDTSMLSADELASLGITAHATANSHTQQPPNEFHSNPTPVDMPNMDESDFINSLIIAGDTKEEDNNPPEY